MNGDLAEIRGAIMSLGRPTNRWIVRFRDATTNLEREFDAYAYDETDAIDLASQWNGGPITVVRTEQRDEVETKPWLVAAVLVPLFLVGLIGFNTCSRPTIYGDCYAGYRGEIDCN